MHQVQIDAAAILASGNSEEFGYPVSGRREEVARKKTTIETVVKSRILEGTWNIAEVASYELREVGAYGEGKERDVKRDRWRLR